MSAHGSPSEGHAASARHAPAANRVYRLILLRHAKAEHPAGVEDMARPLAQIGRRQAPRVGLALRDLGLIPECVLCSSSLRTRQTWELAAAALGDVEFDVRISDDIYDAGVRDVLGALREMDHKIRTVLVVGHEPTMAAAAYHLADGAASDAGALAQVRIGVPTAAYSVLESSTPWDGWGRGTAVLRLVGRPSV